MATKKPELVYDKLQIGEELGSYEYLLTQEMLDKAMKKLGDKGAKAKARPKAKGKAKPKAASASVTVDNG